VRLTGVDGGQAADTGAESECEDRDIAARFDARVLLLQFVLLTFTPYSATATSPGTWCNHAHPT
jgi:hypothetical protein